MTVIYLDNNATTRPLPAAVDAMLRALRDEYGNPSSIHGLGESARKIVDEARARVAELIGARETEVVFTAGATESTNAAIRGCLDAAPAGARRLVTTAVEHEATIEVARHLAQAGVEVVTLPVDSGGGLDLARLESELRKPTAMLSLMLANNETGVIFPVADAARLARAAGASVHVDAVQAVGKIPLRVEELGVDFLSLSGHKFHAPKGVGVLYVRRGARYRPLIRGAGHEGGRRAGTENVPGIAGLGVAAAHMASGIEARSAHLRRLTEVLEERLLRIPGTRINGRRDGRVPGTVNVAFQGIEGAAVVLTAAREGVCLSAGSACAAAQFGGSHVLEAMAVPFDHLYGAVRWSCAETTTESEIVAAAGIVERAVAYLRAMDPAAARSEGR